MKCEIRGVKIRKLERFDDERGWLVELFRMDELHTDTHPVMSYISMTRPGVTRGPHEHFQQSDLITFIGPSTFRLYLWDNRPGSATFGEQFSAEFVETDRAQVIIPPGVVHAYRNVGSVEGLVFNAPNRLYAGQGKTGPVDEIRYENDPQSQYRTDD